MHFRPPCCPHPACPAHGRGRRFPWVRNGFYTRRCDGRRVQRFLCLRCGRRFSTQSFRLDYRLHRPRLHLRFLPLLVSKVTLRQSARILGTTRTTLDRRLRLLGDHCREFQRFLLTEAARGPGLHGEFQLDELETFETDRRLQPVTVPVLMEAGSYFVLHAETAPLPARGRLSPRKERQKKMREARLGRRRSGSRQAVEKTLQALRAAALHGHITFLSDRKASYVGSVRRVFAGRRVLHLRVSGKAPRTHANPLFPINHTLAMLRDGISRLVRRSWGVSKLRERLGLHLWIWIVYRNYLRGVTVKAPRTTPAMIQRVTGRRWSWREVTRVRYPFFQPLLDH